MKVSLAALTFLLVMASSSLSICEPSPASELTQGQGERVGPGPDNCCSGYTKQKKVQLKNLKSYEYASGWCSKPAVIFITKKNLRICADPLQPWVKEYMRHLKPN